MSTLRTDNLQTTDSSFTIAVSSLVDSAGLSSTLTNLLLPYESAVDNVAALLALSWSNRTVVQTMGYYTAFDKGHGLYRKVVGDTTSASNGGTLLVANDGTRLRLVQDGVTNLFQWGAKGDGTTNDTLSVQRGVDWAAAGPFVLRVPSCTGFRLTAPIVTSGSPRLIGDHIKISETIGQNLNTQGAGSWFFIDHTGIGFSFNPAGLVVKRPWVEMIGTYRTQPTPGAGAYTPTLHDYDYVFYNCDSVVRNIVLWNATRGIYVDATPSTSQSRGDFMGIYGCPLINGITINFLADVIRMDRIHFWPYLSSNVNVATYIRNSGVGIATYRCDNPMVTNYFTYGYKHSIYVGNNAQGSTAKLRVINGDFDAFGASAIFIDSQSGSATFSNCVGQGQSSTGSNNFLEISAASSGTNIAIDNIDAGLCGQNVIRCGGTANNVLRVGSNVRLYQWNGSNGGWPAIGCTTGNFVEMSTLPYFTAPLNSGLALDTNGNIKGRYEVDLAVYNTDPDGKFSIPAVLGRSPSSIIASASNSTTAIALQQTGTANVLLASTVTTGAPLANSSVAATAIAIFK